MNYLWIQKSNKIEYENSAKASGLRLKFYSDIYVRDKQLCLNFCNYLRKNYFFPIRVYISFVAQDKFKDPVDGHIYYGIFYPNNECQRKIYPRIFIAAKTYNKYDEYNLLLTIAHELSHYYQWYFFEDEKRTDRSLEIEANKWAKYLVDIFETRFEDD